MASTRAYDLLQDAARCVEEGDEDGARRLLREAAVDEPRIQGASGALIAALDSVERGDWEAAEARVNTAAGCRVSWRDERRGETRRYLPPAVVAVRAWIGVARAEGRPKVDSI